jgi:hypothetical protein
MGICMLYFYSFCCVNADIPKWFQVLNNIWEYKIMKLICILNMLRVEFMVFWLWHCVGWWMDTNISEDHAASIFRVEFHGPLKCWFPTTILCGATTQNTISSVFTSVKIPNLTYRLWVFTFSCFVLMVLT